MYFADHKRPSSFREDANMADYVQNTSAAGVRNPHFGAVGAEFWLKWTFFSLKTQYVIVSTSKLNSTCPISLEKLFSDVKSTAIYLLDAEVRV